MSEHKIFGQIIVNFREYVKKKYGSAGLEDMVSALTFDINSIVDELEYPIEYALGTMLYLEKRYGMEELYRMGRFSVSNIGAKRYFSIFLSPDKILPRMVESVNKVNSSLTIDVKYGNDEATVTVSGPELHSVHAEFWRGMMQGVFDVTKTKGKVEMDDSVRESQDKVIYSLSW